MKFVSGVYLLSILSAVTATTSATAAFLRPTENGSSVGGSFAGSSRSARGMMHHGIDQTYLQSELANFCNQKLVGGSLVSSLLSSDSPTSTMMVADSANPMAAVHEKALDWLNLGSTAISNSFLELPSSFLSSAVADFSAAFDPNNLIPSMIVLASMTITIAVSSTKKTVSNDPAPVLPSRMEMNYDPSETMKKSTTTEPKVLSSMGKSSFDVSSTIDLSAFESVEYPTEDMVLAVVVDEKIQTTGQETTDSSSSMVLATETEKALKPSDVMTVTSDSIVVAETDFAIKKKSSADLQRGPTIMSDVTASVIPGTTTVVAKNANVAFLPNTVNNNYNNNNSKKALKTSTTTSPEAVLEKVARWFVKSLRLVRVTMVIQSMVPLWRARRAEEAKLYNQMVTNIANTKDAPWRKVIVTVVQSPWLRMKNFLTRPGRQQSTA